MIEVAVRLQGKLITDIEKRFNYECLLFHKI